MPDPDSKNCFEAETRPSLLVRIRDKSDAQAWEEFFNLYSPLLFSYAHDRGLSHEDAEDICASCYTTLVQKISEFEYDRNNSGFRAWLRTLVQRRVIDLYRKKQHASAHSCELERIVDQGESPDEAWERNWRVHHIRYCVAQVGKRVEASTLEVFRMLTELDLTVPEICDRMGMNPDRVYQIKSRMLKLIRQELDQFGIE